MGVANERSIAWGDFIKIGRSWSGTFIHISWRCTKEKSNSFSWKIKLPYFYFSYHESFETQKKFYKIYIKKIIKA